MGKFLIFRRKEILIILLKVWVTWGSRSTRAIIVCTLVNEVNTFVFVTPNSFAGAILEGGQEPESMGRAADDE